jgi:hypothetical protein
MPHPQATTSPALFLQPSPHIEHTRIHNTVNTAPRLNTVQHIFRTSRLQRPVPTRAKHIRYYSYLSVNMGQQSRQIIVDAQVEWHFWTALYPLFKHALPDINWLLDSDRKNPTIKNAISKIRQNIRQIPLGIQQPQLNEYLQQANYRTFLDALLSLLDIFEDLVEENVHQPPELGRDAWPSVAPELEKLVRFTPLGARTLSAVLGIANTSSIGTVTISVSQARCFEGNTAEVRFGC